MAWRIEFTEAARDEMAKLDRPVAQRLVAFLRERVLGLASPRDIGQALQGPRLGEFWKYRVGNYRIISRIDDQVLVILVVRVGHRREAYR